MKGFETVLTVAEGKRLIARGLIAWEPFRLARESGVIAVAKGTTNSYLVEELVRDISGDAVDKTTYVTGSTRPAKEERPKNPHKPGSQIHFIMQLFIDDPEISDERVAAEVKERFPLSEMNDPAKAPGHRAWYRSQAKAEGVLPGGGAKTSADMPDLVLRNGKPVEGLSATEAAAEMGPGDVFLKGANAINYALGQAAVLIGHPTGGTLGSALGSIVARKVRLVSPAGLEKEVPGDLGLVAAEARAAGVTPALWVMPSELFTEIEAIEVISGAEAVPVAAGGIGGAEGSVRLLVTGTDEEVAAAAEAIEGVRGEPAFLG
ncbi:MAG: hypothetical protein ACYTKD_24755 [Planctomycetota bacterium]|jgi:hypothetical protein